MKNSNEIKKEATINEVNNEIVKEDKVMERREEIITELKEIIKQIKEEEKELEYFDGEIYYHNDNAKLSTLSKSCEDIDKLIYEYVDNKFIYYSEANKFLEDYDIFIEIKNYNNEFGTIPENECQLAAYILEREIYDYDYNAIEDIYNYIDRIEELQEELAELEELDEDYEER